MNKLYYVPLGCSAREYFIKEIERSGQEESLLVLPSGVLQSRACKEGAVRVKNFDDVASGLLNANGYTNLKRISRRTQELIIEEILKGYAETQQLPYFSVLAEKKGFVKAVAGLMGQLSRSGAKMEEICEALASWDRQGKLGLKDREIAAVYTAYRSRLKAEDWFDVEGLYRLAVYVLQQEKPVVPWRHLYFSEFYRFDGLQTELLRELKRHCGINVGLMYDPRRPELFTAAQNTFVDLSGFLQPEKLNPPVPQQDAMLKVLTENLGGESKTAYSGSSITLYEAASREQKLRTVLRSVKQLLQQGEKCSDILILLRDFSFYAGLRNLSDEYGIPVSLPQTAKLNNEPLTEFLYLLLKKAAANTPAAGAEALWQLLGCRAVKMLFAFDAERLLRLKADKFYQSEAAFKEDCLAVLDEDGRQELERLLALADSLPQMSGVADYCTAAVDALQQLNTAQLVGTACQNGTADYTAVKNYVLAQAKLEEILTQLQADYEAGGLLHKKITAQDFAAVFYEAVQGVELVLQKGDMGGVLITEAANIQGVYYKHVFLLGVREGEFPALKSENWIYNDYERAMLVTLGVDLPSTIAGLNEDRYFFAAACAAALNTLTVSWYSDDSGGASAYVELLQNTFADNSLKSQSCPYVSAGEALSPLELAERLAAADGSNKWLAQQYPYWQQRSGVDYIRASGFNEYSGVLQNDDLLAQLGKKLGSTFSASRLETYAACPFKFLVNYLWRQNEYAEADESLEPADEGSLLHAAAAEFTGRYCNKRLADCDLSALQAEMQEIFAALSAGYEKSGKLKDTVFLPYQKEQLVDCLTKFVAAEYAYSKLWYGYKPAAVELPFGPGTGLGVSVAGTNGQKINLQGRIDRIDSDGVSLYVTDYKRKATPAAVEMERGLDMQLPLYLLAAEQLTKDKSVAGGGYFSFMEAERQGGVFFDAAAKPPFAGKNAKPKDWQEFCTAAQQFIASYVGAMQGGDFKVQPNTQCSPYCPARDICRYNKNAGGAEDNV